MLVDINMPYHGLLTFVSLFYMARPPTSSTWRMLAVDPYTSTRPAYLRKDCVNNLHKIVISKQDLNVIWCKYP